MVSIIGNLKIVNVNASSTVLIGNTASVVLNSDNKQYGGANSFAVGDSIGTVITNNSLSSTNTLDSDLVDQAGGLG